MLTVPGFQTKSLQGEGGKKFKHQLMLQMKLFTASLLGMCFVIPWRLRRIQRETGKVQAVWFLFGVPEAFACQPNLLLDDKHNFISILI